MYYRSTNLTRKPHGLAILFLFVAGLAWVLPPSIQPSTQATDAPNIWSSGLSVHSSTLLGEDAPGRSGCQVVDDARLRNYDDVYSSNEERMADINNWVVDRSVVRESCFVDTDNGLLSIDSPSVQYWAPRGDLNDLIRVEEPVIPVPSSRVVLKTTGQSSSDPSFSSRYSVNYNLFEQDPVIGELGLRFFGTRTNRIFQKEWRFNVQAEPLEFTDGRPMSFYNTWAFSSNGRYAVVAMAYGALVRIDFEKQEITPFYEISSSSRGWSLAISNDGQYAYSARTPSITYGIGSSRIHHLAGCQTTYDFDGYVLGGNNTEGCSSISISEDLEAAYPDPLNGQRLPSSPQFSPNGAELTIDVVDEPSINPRTRIIFSAEGYTSSARGYLALGDSFSSGEGDTQGGTWYEPDTDNQGDTETFLGRNLCHLSRRSYPYLLAVSKGYLNSNLASPPADGLFHSVACSGAKIHNIVGSPLGERQEDGGISEFSFTDNQYRYDRAFDLLEWQPGAAAQKSALTNRVLPGELEVQAFKPEVITLGIGGNDVGFANFLSSCVAVLKTSHTCESATLYNDKHTNIVQLIAQQRDLLYKAYNKVRTESPEARIYVHGYPRFVRGDNCAANVRLSAVERQQVDELIIYMNSIINSAAAKAGVFYVDVSDILAGGELCSGAKQSEILVNGLTAGNDQECDYVGCLIGSESYHPTALGHQRYHDAIIAQTAALTAPMPAPVNTIGIPIPQEALGAIARSRVISMNSDNGVPFRRLTNAFTDLRSGGLNSLTKDALSADVFASNLLPNSEVEVFVESDPISLGTFRVDVKGELNISIELPQELEVGYHELHLYGSDSSGGLVDQYTGFVLGHAQDDFDGDNILDINDTCPAAINVGLDEDLDGIDDACDPIIARPAPSPPANVAAATSDQDPYSVTISWQQLGDATAESYTALVGTDGDEHAEVCTTADTSCTVSGLGLGQAHTFYVIASSDAGDSDASDLSNAVVLQDDTPPSVIGSINQQATQGWYSQPVSIVWTANDDYDGALVAPADTLLDKEGALQTSTPAEVCDSSGNCAAGQQTDINIDFSPPVVAEATLSSAQASVDQSVDLTVQASDLLSGISRVEWHIEGQDPGRGLAQQLILDPQGSWSTGISIDAPGQYSIVVRAADTAGNWSPQQTVSLEVGSQSSGSARAYGWLTSNNSYYWWRRSNAWISVRAEYSDEDLSGYAYLYDRWQGVWLGRSSVDSLQATGDQATITGQARFWQRGRGVKSVQYRVDLLDSKSVTFNIWATGDDASIDDPIYTLTSKLRGSVRIN